MKRCVLYALLAFVFVECLVGMQNLFHIFQEETSITGIEPYQNQTVSLQSECYLMCQRTSDQCSYIQLSHLQNENLWMCSLYNVTGDLSQNHLSPSEGSLISSTLQTNPPTDCLEWRRLGYREDGVYDIKFNGNRKRVFCDMTTDGGGWIVMQKRLDGSVDFHRVWDDYRIGFGDVDGEHWLGNEFIHQYTTHFTTTLRVQASAFDGDVAVVWLKKFNLADESMKYRFDFETGSCQQEFLPTKDLCADWQAQRLIKFSTHNQDNDEYGGSCAAILRTGWWVKACGRVALNGPYSHQAALPGNKIGIVWQNWHGPFVGLKTTVMALRREN
ncbi:microfibril-associated glycoprotein 4-like [Clytia hemisphaerica]|uniref:microfibril-associated glycoprotein 4-like n=1 Tax=Clytia hemisphaerica TaxID=252671 RepID=UPI0034D491E4